MPVFLPGCQRFSEVVSKDFTYVVDLRHHGPPLPPSPCSLRLARSEEHAIPHGPRPEMLLLFLHTHREPGIELRAPGLV